MFVFLINKLVFQNIFIFCSEQKVWSCCWDEQYFWNKYKQYCQASSHVLTPPGLPRPQPHNGTGTETIFIFSHPPLNFFVAFIHTWCPRKNGALALLQQQANAPFFLGHPVPPLGIPYPSGHSPLNCLEAYTYSSLISPSPIAQCQCTTRVVDIWGQARGLSGGA